MSSPSASPYHPHDAKIIKVMLKKRKMGVVNVGKKGQQRLHADSELNEGSP